MEATKAQIAVRVAAFGLALGAMLAALMSVILIIFATADFCLIECEPTPTLARVAWGVHGGACLLLSGAIAVTAFGHALVGTPRRVSLPLVVVVAVVVAGLGWWLGVPAGWVALPVAAVLFVAAAANAVNPRADLTP